MRWKIVFGTVLLFLAGSTIPALGAEPARLVDQVVPIDWKRFKRGLPKGADSRACAQLALNAARHNLAWAPKTSELIEREGLTITGRQAHDIIRPACSVAFAVAVLLKTGIFDENSVGLSREEALRRTIRLISACAAAHNGKSWKYPWQSASWAARLGHASWMLWDDLDPETRQKAAAIVEFEANRFVRPRYHPPYWNGRGGDTKAEENAWNSTILHVAVAMMPRHPNCLKWRRACTELMVSAYSLEKDMEDNKTVVDGRSVKDWLRGYNVRADGAVINHSRVHCDYMCCITLNLRSFIVQSLAGQPVSEAADFNADLIYRTLVTTQWPSPPYKKPGGVMYVPGKAEVYYPTGTDWSHYRFAIFYQLDVHAHLLGFDKDLPHRASSWMRIRARRILNMQSRHEDGRMFAKREFDRFAPREQSVGATFASAFLLHWLHSQNAISRKANWLDDRNFNP